MTVSHRTPPLAAESVDSAVELLRARHLRVSAARRLVLEALFAADKPADRRRDRRRPGGLAARRRTSRRSTATSTRSRRSGSSATSTSATAPACYSLAAAADREFVTCEGCGAFEVVEPARLDRVRELIESELGYRARFTHFPIVGTCAACLAAATRRAPLMHIPDGFLSNEVAVVCAVPAIGAVGVRAAPRRASTSTSAASRCSA